MQYIIIGFISLFLYSPALAETLQGKVVKVAGRGRRIRASA